MILTSKHTDFSTLYSSLQSKGEALETGKGQHDRAKSGEKPTKETVEPLTE